MKLRHRKLRPVRGAVVAVLSGVLLATMLSLKEQPEYVAVTDYFFNSSGRATAANDGNTGAPGEGGLVCATCHGGNNFGNLISTVEFRDTGGNLVTEYVPGDTYEMTLTLTAPVGLPSGYGFQMTSLQNATNTETGTWQNPASNTTIATASNVGNRTYIEHNGTSASNVFTVDWVAPATSTGDVTFYYVGNAVNGNGGTSGDSGTTGRTVTLTEGILSTAEFDFSQNVKMYKADNNNLHITGLPNGTAEIEIYDLIGRKVVEDTFEINMTSEIPLPGSVSGIYIVRLNTAQGTMSKKILL